VNAADRWPCRAAVNAALLDAKSPPLGETVVITNAAHDAIAALARAIRVYTGYARADDEAHNLARQGLTASGDIDPLDGILTVRLDPLPTQRTTTAIAQLCEHLTATQTRYPGTNLVLRYEVRSHP
jgi:hypothetical protein